MPSTWSLSKRKTTSGKYFNFFGDQYLIKPPRFKKQFSSYLADGVGSDDIEEIYTNAYEAIREDPTFKPTEKDVAKWKAESLKYKTFKLTKEQKQERIQSKIAAYQAGKLDVEEDEE